MPVKEPSLGEFLFKKDILSFPRGLKQVDYFTTEYPWIYKEVQPANSHGLF